MTALRVLGIALLLLLGVGVFFLRWAAPDGAPQSLVFLGGEVITMVEPLEVEAIWVKDGLIQLLGSRSEVLEAAGTDVHRVDLDGATLMPGFIEPHTHPLATALLGAALREAGIDRDTPDPPAAAFGRDENGDLTGSVLEVNAINYLLRAVPALPPAVTALLLRWQFADYARAGFTTIGVLGVVGRAEDPIGLLQSLAADAHVPVRTVVYGLPQQLDIEAKPEAMYEARFAIRGVKFWMDGSLFTGGAAFAEPYEDTALTRERMHLAPDRMGPLNYGLEAFTTELGRFHRAGYHVAIHTQGERAVQRVLDAAASVLAEHPWPDHRHRLEHNALITGEQIRRAKALGFELSFFTDHIYYYGDRLAEIVGDRVDRYMPVGTAFRDGHHATIHSDNPATPIGPLRVMRTAILRTPRKGHQAMGSSERLSIDQALRAMTTNAAWQLGIENHRGSLEAGKAADLLILSRNPMETPPEELDSIEVLGTWIDGQPVDTRRASRPNLGLALRALAQLATPNRR